MNKTGQISPNMINYIMHWFTEVPILIGSSNWQLLHEGNKDLQEYQKNNPNFTVQGFFIDAGFSCSDIFKLCSFQGET